MFDPFGNTSSVPAANWRPEPNGRGTWSVLSSCLITLGLCVWTCLHLNIPKYGTQHMQKWRKLGWLTLGLLAPEIVAWVAWHQRRRAYHLTETMREILGQAPERTLFQKLCDLMCRPQTPTPSGSAAGTNLELENQQLGKSRLPEWTIVHSFYAIMGGFAFGAGDEEVNFLPGGRQRVTVTFDGLVFISRIAPELIPSISKSEIEDKSKANGLAKGLVCIQASWFAVQCITRLAQGLAISLLELNVFGHAICTLLVYGLWWYKPLDVSEPTLLQGDGASEMRALAFMKSCPYGCSRRPFSPANLMNGEKIGNSCTLAWEPSRAAESESCLNISEYKGEEKFQLKCGNNLFGFRYTHDYHRRQSRSVGHTCQFSVALDASELNCWRLCARAVVRWGLFDGIPRPFLLGDIGTDNIVSDNIKEWPWARSNEVASGYLEANTELLGAFGLTFAGAAYGGLHLVAWNVPFGSRTEQILWRFSGIVVASALLPSLAMVTAWDTWWYVHSRRLANSLARVWIRITGWILNRFEFKVALAIFVALDVAAFLLSRVYLVVECYIQLAHLPPSAYATPNWSRYFPHIV